MGLFPTLRILLVILFFSLLFPLRRHTFVDTELSVDESQTIAAAITLAAKPYFWKSVEEGTLGPVHPLILNASALLGWSLGYANARRIGTFLIFISGLSLFAFFRRFSGYWSSFLAATPVVIFFGLVINGDYLAYNGEHSDILLLSIALALLGIALTSLSRRYRFISAFGLGLVAGLVPLTKLQGAPIALVILLTLPLGCALTRLDRKLFLKMTTFLTAGAATPYLILATYLFASGAYSNFFHFYLLRNITYANYNPATWSERWQCFLTLTDRFQAFEQFGKDYVGWIQYSFLLVVLRYRTFSALLKTSVICAALCVATSIYSATRPNNYFDHYFLFIMWAGILGGGTFLIALLSSFAGRRWIQTAIAVSFVICMLYLPLATKIRGKVLPTVDDSTKMEGREVAAEILKYARPSDSITIWGWQPSLYVLTGLTQGTMSGATFWEIRGDKHSYNVFVSQFAANKPAVFIDVVGPHSFSFTNEAKEAHEAFPELNEYVETHYTFIKRLEGDRLYVRNDLVER
jgi:hypothetical protein